MVSFDSSCLFLCILLLGWFHYSSSHSFVSIKCLQLPQLSRLKPKLSLTAQTILELSPLGSDWPDLGHMSTIEPITGVQQPHALPMLGGRTGSTQGLRTISGLCIEEERMDAVETRCCSGGWGWHTRRSGGKSRIENQSYRETHLLPWSG